MSETHVKKYHFIKSSILRILLDLFRLIGNHFIFINNCYQLKSNDIHNSEWRLKIQDHLMQTDCWSDSDELSAVAMSFFRKLVCGNRREFWNGCLSYQSHRNVSISMTLIIQYIRNGVIGQSIYTGTIKLFKLLIKS